MEAEHTSFFAEHGWAITSVLVLILGGLIATVGFFVKRLITEHDKDKTISLVREDKFETSINKLDRCVVRLDATINTQQEVSALQHRALDKFMIDTKKYMDKNGERMGAIETKIAKME